MKVKQDPVSTMQKTGWTNHSSFLVLYGSEKGFTLEVSLEGSQQLFSCVLGPFWHGDLVFQGIPNMSYVDNTLILICF